MQGVSALGVKFNVDRKQRNAGQCCKGADHNKNSKSVKEESLTLIATIQFKHRFNNLPMFGHDSSLQCIEGQNSHIKHSVRNRMQESSCREVSSLIFTSRRRNNEPDFLCYYHVTLTFYRCGIFLSAIATVTVYICAIFECNIAQVQCI